MLTTKVMPEETTHPKPAMIARISVTYSNEKVDRGYGVDCTGNGHTVIERVFRSDAVDSKNEEWNHE